VFKDINKRFRSKEEKEKPQKKSDRRRVIWRKKVQPKKPDSKKIPQEKQPVGRPKEEKPTKPKVDIITPSEIEVISKPILKDEKVMDKKEEEPLIKFEGDASAPILRYDLPSPSSYTAKNYIEINFPITYFDPETTQFAFSDDLIDNLFDSNAEVIKEFLSNVSREELEQELYYLGLKIEEETPEPEEDTGAWASASTTVKKSYSKLGVAIRAPPPPNPLLAFLGPIGLVVSVFDVVAKAKALADARAAAAAVLAAQQAAAAAAASASQKAEAERSAKEAADKAAKEQAEADRLARMETLEGKYLFFKYYISLLWEVERKIPLFSRTLSGKLRISYVSVPEESIPQLILIETHKLTTFPGDYGAGTVVKTFSLLPREETEISVKTWKKTEEETKKASSILDSYTEEKADEFEKGIQKENSSSQRMEKTDSYSVGAKAGGSWGGFSASVSGDKSGSTTSARESMASNVMNTLENHSQSASSLREINIDTSFEKKTETGKETAIMRRVKNINANKTLNFVFRQMNQEYHSLIHITDIRIGYFNGFPGSMEEFTLAELPELVEKYMKNSDAALNELNAIIKNEYQHVLDHQGDFLPLIETKKIELAGVNSYEYLRVIPPTDPRGQQEYEIRKELKYNNGSILRAKDIRIVDGIIIDTKKLTIKTDGIIVESLLGKSPALDTYSLKLQIEENREQKLKNDKIEIGVKLIEDLRAGRKFDEAVKAYKNIFGFEEAFKRLYALEANSTEYNE